MPHDVFLFTPIIAESGRAPLGLVERGACLTSNQPLLMQVGTRIREIANPSNRVGERRRKEVYALPDADHEVKGPTASNGRAGAVENRTYALPATIVSKSAVTRSRRGVITRHFANTMKYGDEGRTKIRG